MNTPAFLIETDRPHPQLSGPVDGAFDNYSRQNESSGHGSALWETANRLTLSFAPDGTAVSKYQSSLYSTFGHLLTASQLEETILDAFQEWASNSAINIGLVSDSGDALGTTGPTQGDQRFGDIRIAAVPMAGDVFAVAVPHDDFLSGTWAGDILFNSNADFSSVNQVYSIALHEAGHVFGLDHSVDPTSAMHPTIRNDALNVSDIQNLKDLYGERILDQYDVAGDRNDSMNNAVEIRNTGSVDGVVPLVTFGDIESASDNDYFSIRPNSHYNGSISFRLISESISLLRGRLYVTDSKGTLLATASSSSTTGTEISVQLANVSDDEEYFVRVDSIGDAENRFGSYALVTTIDDNVDPAKLQLVGNSLRGNYSWLSQNDVQDLFLNDFESNVNADFNSNDSAAAATVLEESLIASAHSRYRIQASIENTADLDFYRIEAFDSTMAVRLNAMQLQGLIADVRVFDSSLQEVAGETLVNGNGELLMNFATESGNDYFIAIGADQPGGLYETGNYDLNVAFDSSFEGFESLGSGQLNQQQQSDIHTLYVARSQLFHFALTAASGQSSNAAIWMSIYDEDGRLAYRVATRPGETRTAQSVLLRPGSYSIRVNVTVPQSLIRRQSVRFVPTVNYQIDGIGVSDPTGPEAIDPSEDPFAPCDRRNSPFCYPGDRRSFSPFIVIDDDELTLTNPPANPPWQNPNDLYWNG